LAEHHTAADIGVVVAQRLAHAFTHGFQPGAMHDGIDRVVAQYRVEQTPVSNITKNEARPLAGQHAYSVDCRALAVAQVIQDQNLFASNHTLQCDMRTDVSRTACNQDHALALVR
jgi:hypothetical protein